MTREYPPIVSDYTEPDKHPRIGEPIKAPKPNPIYIPKRRKKK